LQNPDGTPLSNEQIAKGVNCPTREVESLLDELTRNHVLMRTNTGVIYSSQLLRDGPNKKRQNAGRKGGRKTGRLLKQIKQRDSPQEDTSKKMLKQCLSKCLSNAQANSVLFCSDLSSPEEGCGEKPVLPGFAAFWAAYPTQEDELPAKEAWAALGPDPPIEAILDSLERWKKTARWRAGYVPFAAKWLADRRWEKVPKGSNGQPPKTEAELAAETLRLREQEKAQWEEINNDPDAGLAGFNKRHGKGKA
jgi:hypothetical protein